MIEEFDGDRASAVPRGGGATPEVRVVRLERVGSTNREAERLVGGGASGPLAVVAREMTAGEGRRGHAWSAPAGGLWMTLAWRIEDEGVLEGLGLRLGVGCLRTVRSAGGAAAGARLKWPNDVLVEGKKVCGCMGRVVAGAGGRWVLVAAGINANNAIEPDLAARAASLRDLTGEEIDLAALEARLLEEMIGAVRGRGVTEALLREANEALAGAEERIRVVDGGEVVEGTLVGLGRLGTPRVRTGAGVVVEVGVGAEVAHGG